MVSWSQKGTTPDRQETPMKYTFKGTPSQLRAMYEHGLGVSEIMRQTGEDYETVQNKLKAAGTKVQTGGPKNKCRHPHEGR